MAQKFKVDPKLARRERILSVGQDRGRGESEWVQIGRLAEDGPRKDVRLDLSHEHVLAIVGKRGSGKSFTLGSFIEGLATTEQTTSINRVSGARATLLIDTLNIFQWTGVKVTEDAAASSHHVREQAELLKRWKLAPVELAVDLWTPVGYEAGGSGPVNPLSIRVSDMEAADWADLLNVDAVQSTLGQLLSQAFGKVTARGWSDRHGQPHPPNPSYLISDLLECLENDPELAADYVPETRRALRQRLTAYEATPLFGPQGTGLDDVLKPGRLSVLLMSGVPDDLRLTIVFLLIRKLLFARAAASEKAKTR